MKADIVDTAVKAGQFKTLAAALQAARSDALQSFIDGVRGQCEQAILQREARPRPALDVLPWDAWAAEEEPSIESVTCGVEGERRS